MPFVTMKTSKLVRGTLYAAGGRYEIKNAATLAELWALRDEGSIRTFSDTAPTFIRSIVSDVTYYFNVSPYVNLLVSVNARMSAALANIVLVRLADVNQNSLRSTHCDWLVSDGTENLERYVQLFGAPKRRKISDQFQQFYFLEFGFDSANVPADDVLEKRVRDLCGYLVSLHRLEPATQLP